MSSATWLDDAKGMVQAFRRPGSTNASIQVKLRGLRWEKQYLLTNPDESGTRKIRGKELMENGLTIKLPQAPDSAIILYKRTIQDY